MINRQTQKKRFAIKETNMCCENIMQVCYLTAHQLMSNNSDEGSVNMASMKHEQKPGLVVGMKTLVKPYTLFTWTNVHTYSRGLLN